MELIRYNQMVEILGQVALFSDIKNNPEALDMLAKMMQRKNYAKGAKLIEQDSAGDEFFVLVSGSVSVSKKTPEGDAYKVVVLHHSQYPSFGEGGLMEGEVRSASILSETDCECLVLSRTKFDEFCRTAPQYALPVFKKISQALMMRLNQTSNDLMLLHKALMDEIRSND